MSAARQIFDIGICPSPGKRQGKEWRAPVPISESYDEATNRLTVTVGLVRAGRIAPDRIYEIYLCRVGLSCGCGYGAEVHWQILEHCGAKLYWTWPSDAV